MVNLSFVCRASKANRFGKAPIEMALSVDGRRTYIQMNLRCLPEEYAQAMKGAGNTEILEYVTALRKKVDAIVIHFTKEGIPVTAETVKAAFKKNLGGAYTLNDLFTEYLSILSARVGKEIMPDTYDRYVRAAREFLESNGLDALYPAAAVGLKECLAYQQWLVLRKDVSTSRGYLQKIKTIFKYAFETGKIPSNPAYGLKIQKGVKDTVQYLTQEELGLIENKELGPRLGNVRDVFLFSCYTGISYGDICELSPEDFKTLRGWTYVDKARKKTGVKFMAVILPKALEIARKYDYRLPVRSNQKMNAYLKEIGDICGIEKPLHFHMARHTAACYFLNYRPAIPGETIQRMFGWTSQKQLRHYARLFGTTVLDDMENAFGPSRSVRVPFIPDREMQEFQKILGI